MTSYVKECKKPIPIGMVEFAYQCENVTFEPVHGKINIWGSIPHNGGKLPYPNEEKDKIGHYELEIGRFTGNSIEVTLTKVFKDKSQEIYSTNFSFADLVNTIFFKNPANVFYHEAPVNNYPKQLPE